MVACSPGRELGSEGRAWSGLLLLPNRAALAHAAEHVLSINCVFKSGPSDDLFSKMASDFWYMLTVLVNFQY